MIKIILVFAFLLGTFNDPHHQTISHPGRDQFSCAGPHHEWNSISQSGSPNSGRELFSPGRGGLEIWTSRTSLDF